MSHKEKKDQKFETGNIYSMSFIGDSDLKPDFICINRTEKFATFQRFKDKTDTLKRKIHRDTCGNEYILAGNYSMAPSINAARITG